MKESELKKLMDIQMRIAKKIVTEDWFRAPIKLISGVDSTFFDDSAIVACVTLNYATLKVFDKKILVGKIGFPYVPGFLGFREGPLIMNIMENLDVKPDIFIINAQGIAHPRFCGCASHVGVLTERPTIGVTKSKLCGEYYKEPECVGEWVPLVYEGKTVGAVFKSKRGCKPIFISPGHLISLESSIQIVKRCIRGHKLPEPLYLAHKLATEERRKFSQ